MGGHSGLFVGLRRVVIHIDYAKMTAAGGQFCCCYCWVAVIAQADPGTYYNVLLRCSAYRLRRR